MTIKEESLKWTKDVREVFLAGANCEAVQILVDALERVYDQRYWEAEGAVSHELASDLAEAALRKWKEANE